MVDLTTTYLGLKLKNPLVASASPLSKKLDTVKRLEDAGISAVVMYSLFEEQIIHESNELDFKLNQGTESYAEALTYFPDMEKYNLEPDQYLALISELKSNVSIPIIASLNGVSSGGWVHYAKLMEQAGADALELNLYYIPTDINIGSQDLEMAYINIVKLIRSQIKIPMALKLSPFITCLPNFATRLVRAGVNGLVFFNRFYQPDLDIETLEVVPNLTLSTSSDLRLPLRWIAILYDQVKTDLALSSGVHTSEDMVKAIMAGANAVMTTSELLEKGPERAAEMIEGFSAWMETLEYESVSQMRGSLSQKNVAEPSAFERANYMKVLNSFKPIV